MVQDNVSYTKPTNTNATNNNNTTITSINNNYQNNVANTQRFLISGQAHTSIGRISLQYGRDTEIKNGFVQTRLLAVRVMKEF